MKYTLAALVALAASMVSAQAVTSIITPPSSAPSDCVTSFTGNFEINVSNATTSKRDLPLEKRVTVCGGAGTLVLTLANGELHDAFGRTGYIASNYQFQFDKPPQAGAIYTAGFSLCANNTIALGGSAVFYQCLSGTFYNLYDQSTGGQCSPAYIDIIPCVVEGATTTTYSAATNSASSNSASSTATGVIVTPSVTGSATTTAANSTLITSTVSLSTASSVILESSITGHSNSTISTAILPSTTKSSSLITSAPATTTATIAPSASAVSTAGAAMFSFGIEVAAMAAGAVAFAMI